ncbi:ATP-binding cassette domain-containing protein [Gracilibacillus salitolerans]|uniref:ATP-binding cassette domain-containing protein n=1 Tax=Gracilibacillus salitolerans TaxID=2663022 RepID=A0A5Q2TFD3_9BACI|nr:ABC transporter ATP-binding protein [Gracilibacillus salitolerans]QGH32831.1 ATP-binding cassette domain-containing protein [Gracilibacillus salitolerans]
MNSEKILAKELSFSYGNSDILKDINAVINKGEITVLLGVNGSGKSTLLKTISRLLTAKKGTIYLDGKDIANESNRSIAKKLAMLSQINETLDMTVYELVEQGRFPHAGALKMLRKQDHQAIDNALERTSLQHLQHHFLNELSGGERQRAWLALALAQETEVLLLDEPTTFMDVHHQINILNLITSLNREEGKTIVMVLHDINQALAYADRVIVLRDGRIYNSGPPLKVITPDMLFEVFQVKANIITDPDSHHTVYVPYSII